jgi:PPOX class probable F420-dependent enzyme
MTTPDPALLDLFAAVRNGILITLKRDGRPQSSIVSHRFDAGERTLHVSLTDDRAKTRNLRRDPRATYHVSRPDMRGYVVGEAVAELSPVAADPHDDTVESLVAYYRAVAGEHPDWDEYRAAMVADRRLLLTLRLDHVYGWTGSR